MSILTVSSMLSVSDWDSLRLSKSFGVSRKNIHMSNDENQIA